MKFSIKIWRVAGFKGVSRCFLLALALAIIPMGAAGASDVYRGHVERVIDGDTISLLTNDYERLRVRLYGVDAPEKNQEWGPQSTGALSAKIAGREVEVIVEDVDRYSRQVGIIFLDGENVNLWLVSKGHAWIYERYCVLADVCRAMSEAQNKAQALGVGLWSMPAPKPPWEHRRRR